MWGGGGLRVAGRRQLACRAAHPPPLPSSSSSCSSPPPSPRPPPSPLPPFLPSLSPPPWRLAHTRDGLSPPLLPLSLSLSLSLPLPPPGAPASAAPLFPTRRAVQAVCAGASGRGRRGEVSGWRVCGCGCRVRERATAGARPLPLPRPLALPCANGGGSGRGGRGGGRPSSPEGAGRVCGSDRGVVCSVWCVVWCGGGVWVCGVCAGGWWWWVGPRRLPAAAAAPPHHARTRTHTHTHTARRAAVQRSPASLTAARGTASAGGSADCIWVRGGGGGEEEEEGAESCCLRGRSIRLARRVWRRHQGEEGRGERGARGRGAAGGSRHLPLPRASSLRPARPGGAGNVEGCRGCVGECVCVRVCVPACACTLAAPLPAPAPLAPPCRSVLGESERAKVCADGRCTGKEGGCAGVAVARCVRWRAECSIACTLSARACASAAGGVHSRVLGSAVQNSKHQPPG